MELLGQALLLLLVSSVGIAEVVLNFSETCGEFFANPNGEISPPTVFQGSGYRQICQKRAGQTGYEFATHYDTNNRIPVYSSYVYEGRQTCDRKDVWFIEPQIDDDTKGPSMAPDSRNTLSKPPRGDRQALNSDYTNSQYYDKGHLYPVYHTNTQSCADATFTLTNAAPQDKTLNRSKWKQLENKLTKLLKEQCLPNKAYMVTGVVPSVNPAELLKNRVNVPSHFWTAYCCLDNNKMPIKAQGYLVPNSNQEPRDYTVNDLDQELSRLYGSDFKVFGGKCNTETVSVNESTCMDLCQRLPKRRLANMCALRCRKRRISNSQYVLKRVTDSERSAGFWRQ